MTPRHFSAGVLIMFFAMFGGQAAHAAAELPKPNLDLPATRPTENATAVFAGGCFWCVEGVFEQLDGVSDATSGYSGGSAETATYKQVCEGNTGHAEAVKITYDPAKIGYGELLRVFFTTHDPTTLNRQGPDSGTQYRSAIFYENEDQKKVAEAYIEQLNEATAFPKPIVTSVEPLKGFYKAEDYHQNYVTCNPNNPYIRQWAVPKIQKVKEKFPEQTKENGKGQ